MYAFCPVTFRLLLRSHRNVLDSKNTRKTHAKYTQNTRKRVHSQLNINQVA